MTALGKFLSPQKAQALSQAYDAANKITDITRNPVEAMQKAGITLEDLTTARRLINNPLSGFIINRLGVSRDDILTGISKAEEYLKQSNTPTGMNSLSTEQTPVDELQSLRDNLARIK